MQDESPKGTRIAHVGLAVESIDAELPFFRDVLGMSEVPVDDSDGARITALSAGESLVELLEPAGTDTPIGKFLAKRGAGIHHICFAVEDIDAIVARLEVGLTYEAMAKVLGKPSWNAARMATARALLRLAEELERGP